MLHFAYGSNMSPTIMRKHAPLAQPIGVATQGERAGIYWRDCKKAQCRRARRCLFPQPCYWDRKRAMPPAEWAKAEAACRPLRALLSLGSLKGSEGLWLF